MKRSINKLTSYKVETKDGKKGKIKDFLFDEKFWIIRYLEADFGKFFEDKRVLIPRIFLKYPEWDGKNFPLEVEEENIKNCPDISSRKPVSREYEKLLSDYYGISYYWPYGYTAPVGTSMFPSRPFSIPEQKQGKVDVESSLRSFDEVKGYHIRGKDGTIGHVEDLLVDDIDWQIVYLIVDTSNWLPWSKKVILSIEWLDEINYPDAEVSISLKKDTIKNAPEYDPESELGLEIEKGIYDFYSRSFVK